MANYRASGPGQSITERVQRARTTGATSSIAAATSGFSYVHQSDAKKTIFSFTTDIFFHLAVLHRVLDRWELPFDYFELLEVLAQHLSDGGFGI